MLAEVSASKQRMQNFNIERFNLKRVNEVDGKNQYQVKISNRFAVLENLEDDVHISKTWENIRENLTISAKENISFDELKQHKP